MSKMNWETIIVAIITAGFAFLGVYISNRKSAAVMEYRIKQLEIKVDKHNNVIERTYKLEQEVKDMKEQKRA